MMMLLSSSRRLPGPRLAHLPLRGYPGFLGYLGPVVVELTWDESRGVATSSSHPLPVRFVYFFLSR